MKKKIIKREKQLWKKKNKLKILNKKNGRKKNIVKKKTSEDMQKIKKERTLELMEERNVIWRTKKMRDEGVKEKT